MVGPGLRLIKRIEVNFMLRYSLSFLCVALIATMVGAQEKPKHTTDSIQTVKENIKNEKALLLDVREQKEWDAGHLKAARLVPLSKLSAAKDAKSVKDVGKDKILYLHCRSGRRVLQAAEQLQAMGYDARPLKWGYEALMDEGFEKAK
jgi:phage shock protein E